MRRFFGRKDGNNMIIEGDEFNHLKNVLRLGVGQEVMISINDENEYVCEITEIAKKQAVCKINGVHKCLLNPKKNIVLFQAMAKKDTFEAVVQKATEIGISRIVPFMTKFCVAKPTENKIERLQVIAQNACNQCERTIVPVIEKAINVDEMIERFKDFDIVLLANERTDNGEKPKEIVKAKNIAIIVGSEGGFDPKEKDKMIAAGAVSISLGKRILRVETASVSMMSLISILSGN